MEEFDLEQALREEAMRNARRRPLRQDEHHTQVKCVEYFRRMFPQYSLYFFAVPNGGERSATSAAKVKAEGVLAGVSDLLLLLPRGNYHGLCIEMKTPKGVQSKAQKEWERAITEQGFLYVIARSFDEFVNITNNYLALPEWQIKNKD